MIGPELASKVIKRWWNRRRPNPPRALRTVLEINGRTFVDISSPLALSMIDCEYGKPVQMCCGLTGQNFPDEHVVKLIFTEVDP